MLNYVKEERMEVKKNWESVISFSIIF